MRVAEIDGKPWFVAADVCRCLGMHLDPRGNPNVSVATRSLGQDEGRLYQIQTASNAYRLKVITESGLYKLIMRSDKPEARLGTPDIRFRVAPVCRWCGHGHGTPLSNRLIEPCLWELGR